MVEMEWGVPRSRRGRREETKLKSFSALQCVDIAHLRKDFFTTKVTKSTKKNRPDMPIQLRFLSFVSFVLFVVKDCVAAWLRCAPAPEQISARGNSREQNFKYLWLEFYRDSSESMLFSLLFGLCVFILSRCC